MKFYNNPGELSFVRISDYADSSIGAFSAYGLTFHAIKNCMAMGNQEQTLLPAAFQARGGVVFEESYRRDHNIKERWRVYQSGISANVETLDEAVPLYPIWACNFWHWTFDCMPVLAALENSGYKGAYIVPKMNFIKEFLELFEIDKLRIFFSGPVYHIKNAIIPMRFAAEKYLINQPGALALLRENLLDKIGVLQGERFIYIKRLHSRRIENEEEVAEILSEHDFETLIPEEHSVREQFRSLTNCAVSFMPHGANTTLCLAQKNRSALLECFRFSYVNPCNLHTVALLKLLYFPIVQKIHSSSINKATNQTNGMDIRVDPDFLKVIINNVLSRARER